MSPCRPPSEHPPAAFFCRLPPSPSLPTACPMGGRGLCPYYISLCCVNVSRLSSWKAEIYTEAIRGCLNGRRSQVAHVLCSPLWRAAYAVTPCLPLLPRPPPFSSPRLGAYRLPRWLLLGYAARRARRLRRPVGAVAVTLLLKVCKMCARKMCSNVRVPCEKNTGVEPVQVSHAESRYRRTGERSRLQNGTRGRSRDKPHRAGNQTRVIRERRHVANGSKP